MLKHIAIAALLLIRVSAHAQSWVKMNDLDNTVYALANVNDKVYAGGSFHYTMGYPTSPHVAMYTALKNWQTLGNGLDSTVYALIGYSGQVYAGGEGLMGGSHIARWDGTKWNIAGGTLNGPVYCFAIYNGNLYAGGAFALPGGISGIAKWDGDLNWLAVGAGMDNPVHALAVHNGALYAGGEFGAIGSLGASYIAKWNDTTWSILGTNSINGTDGPVSALADYNGKLYVGGTFTHAGGKNTLNLASWNDTTWSAVGAGLDGPVWALNGQSAVLYIGGAFTSMGGIQTHHILGSDGSSMYPLGMGMDSTGIHALLDYHGDLYAGGTYSTAGGIPANNIARWSSTANVSVLSAVKIWDRDGSLATSADWLSIPWFLSIYKDSVSHSSLILSSNAPSISTYITAPGKYITVEADSGTGWTRLNGNHSRFDTIIVSLNSSPIDTFFNFLMNARLPLALGAGWNMVSNPLNVLNRQLGVLFPGAASQAFFYDHKTGYYSQTDLINGPGFWLKFNSDFIDTITGFDITSYNIVVKSGWNIIGSISKPVPVNAITENPSNIVTSPFYGYANGYFQADTILPGKSYWVKVGSDGQLLLRASGSLNASGTRKTPIENLGTITITDAAGKSGVIYVGTEQQSSLDASSYDLPPLPPRGAFDVRFSSGKNVEFLSKSSTGEASPLQITSAMYPLRLAWSIPNMGDGSAYLLYDGRTGKQIITLDGAGNASLAKEIPDVRIKLVDGIQLPKTFALHQNYPNPFNPATAITFDLPVKADVVLTVFDQLGRVVATPIMHAQLGAGVHSVSWDASNVATGVYFYRFSATAAGNNRQVFSDVKKMLVIK
ncbi:MAG: T9SS type A sorting domain-containing protein [Bacteroidota bacterium]